jgi:monoamine oxidase
MRGRSRIGPAGRLELSRREFVRAAAGLAALAAPGAVGARLQSPTAAREPQVVIVGSGIAGLGCSYLLWRRHGIHAPIFEYDDHPGGRIQTLRGFFADGQIVEQHGEFISSEHTALRALARGFGLSLESTATQPAGVSDEFRFGGRDWPQAEVDEAWQSWGWALFRDAVRKAPWPTQHDRHTPSGLRWDRMSVLEWIDTYVPGGTDSTFGRFCVSAVLADFGGPPAQQSALNLVYLLGLDSSTANGFQPKDVPVPAGTDEAWHIRGGNDQVITGLLDRLPSTTVSVGERLVAVRRRGTGRYVLTFASGASVHDVYADHVVLALPYVKLREVDLSGIELSRLHRLAIDEQPLGSNDKIELQFRDRVWYSDGRSGNLMTDGLAQSAWEATNYQPGRAGILIAFPGGSTGFDLGSRYGLTSDEGVAPARMVSDYLASLEPSFPGVTSAWNGRAYYQWSSGDRHIGGAYSYLKVGQYTSFNGVQPTSQAGVHFAGEHTSLDFQGFMEGALRSGFRCAREIARLTG